MNRRFWAALALAAALIALAFFLPPQISRWEDRKIMDQPRITRVEDREGLADSLGIASMQDDGTGYLNVKIGFDGYNGIKTQRWPNGQPNQMVARSVESGTTWMKKNPFVRKAVTASRKRALEYMKDSVDRSIEEIMEGD